MKACPSHYAGVEHSFSLNMLSCKPDGNPAPTVSWYFQGEQMNASQTLTRSQSGSYTAEVINSLGGSNTSVIITIECEHRFNISHNSHFLFHRVSYGLIYSEISFGEMFTDGPSFACDSHYEVKDKDNHQAVACEAEGIPTPTITWFKNGINISPKRWTERDNGTYTLKATNKHGTANHTIYVDVLCKS